MRNLIASVLALVVGFLLNLFFAAIGFDMDPGVFTALVGAIVAWFMTNLFADMAILGPRAALK
jgi:hypothetical protein